MNTNNETTIALPKALAEILERRASKSRTAEQFGDAIIRASLHEAARLIKEGKAKDGRVEFSAQIWIRFVPDPNQIDVGFEECMASERRPHYNAI